MDAGKYDSIVNADLLKFSFLAWEYVIELSSSNFRAVICSFLNLNIDHYLMLIYCIDEIFTLS